MIHAHITTRRAVPLWAAIGAPLLGVPIMVALLALAAPPATGTGEQEANTITTEQLEVPAVELAIERG